MVHNEKDIINNIVNDDFIQGEKEKFGYNKNLIFASGEKAAENIYNSANRLTK